VQTTRFTTTYDEDTATLTVAGDVDEDASVSLREALDDASRTGELHAVDLSGVTLLPSFGIGVLAVALRQAADEGRGLDLVAAQGSISQRVLEICGLPYRTA
jgi:anti-anti-sigma factor